MRPTESATKILKVLKKGAPFKVLRDLAKEAGFNRINQRDFKDGLNYLIEKDILKLEQSGWPSEKRAGKNHPKGVVLLEPLYVLGELEEEEETKRPVGKVQDIPDRHNVFDELVKIHALGGDESYITKSEYEKSKDGINFWTHTHTLTK